MDRSEESPRVLSTCTGYGGLELGLAAALGRPLRVIAYVEREAYACANLVTKVEAGALPCAPIWTDLRSFNSRQLAGSIDVLTGGYPCQPFSVAGKRLGADDPRHLWPEYVRIIGECRPGWCFFENVRGHVSKGLREVRCDLERLGYRFEADLFSAEEVGANHRRERIYILAHANGVRESQPRWRLAPERGRARDCGPQSPATVAAAVGGGLGRDNGAEYPAAVGTGWWDAEPDVGRVAHGSPNRVDRLRLLGNGVVPQCAEHAFRTLYGRFL